MVCACNAHKKVNISSSINSIFKEDLLTIFTILLTNNIMIIYIAQNEWKSLIIHDRRSGKFECTNALNKLQIREEWAFFGPPALIKLLGATSLAPK